MLGGLLLVISVGCGGANPLNRQAVSGQVTLDGVPLATGNIEFAPLGESQVTGSGAVIVNGRYEIPQLRGLAPGKYRIRLHAATESNGPATAKPSVGQMPPEVVGHRVGVELIPARYNTKSELAIEVVAGPKNTFDFDVKSK
jgi:hypothetical protein